MSSADRSPIQARRRRRWIAWVGGLVVLGLVVWLVLAFSALSSAQTAANRAWGATILAYSNRNLTVAHLLNHMKEAAPQQREQWVVLGNALGDALAVGIPPRQPLRHGPELANIEAMQRALATTFVQTLETLHSDPALAADPELDAIEAAFAEETAVIAKERVWLFQAIDEYNRLQQSFPASLWALDGHQPVVGMSPAAGPLPQ